MRRFHLTIAVSTASLVLQGASGPVYARVYDSVLDSAVFKAGQAATINLP